MKIINVKLVASIIASLLYASCSVIRENPKYQFADGKYSSGIFGEQHGKVYVEKNEDMMTVYPLKRIQTGYIPDTGIQKAIIFPTVQYDTLSLKSTFAQSSFDIDFLTIPFKYRFEVQGFPRQFNTNLNGGVYFGYRNDLFLLRYVPGILGQSKLSTTHFGFSFGAYSGLGGTAINPWVTSNQINIEYDGVVWTKGIVGIIGFNNFSAGLAVGWDLLLDKHKRFWIYQDKPWVGFAFGLNLN